MTGRIARNRRPLIFAGIFLSLIVFATTLVPAAWAAWTARVTAGGNATVGSLSVSVTMSDQLRPITHSTLTDARVITVTNTTSSSNTTLPVNASVELFAPEENALATYGDVSVFPVDSAAACTASTAVPPGAAQGTWKNRATLDLGVLPPGQSATLCAKTTVANWMNLITATGEYTITPSVEATLTLHNFTATSATSSSLQSVAIYPIVALGGYYYQLKVADTLDACLAMKKNGDGYTNGAVVEYVTCLPSSQLSLPTSFPQQFDISARSTADGTSWVIPRVTPSVALNSVLGLFTLSFQNRSNPPSLLDGWFIELRPGGTLQLVSADKLLCVSAFSSGLVECRNLPGQSFEMRRGGILGAEAPFAEEATPLSPRLPRQAEPDETEPSEISEPPATNPPTPPAGEANQQSQSGPGEEPQ